MGQEEEKEMENNREEFNQRRVCRDCGKPITDGNVTGICKECWREKSRITRESSHYKGESQGHKDLKLIAHRFLSKLGCVVLGEEYSLQSNGRRLRFDVLGKTKEDKLIAVECGGSQLKKLQRMKAAVDAVYILPHNSKMPYLWLDNMKICQNCGNLISVAE